KGTADTAKHPKAQHVDLEQADRSEIVLVPLDECTIFHGGIADRDALHERPAREHEATDMLGKMAGKANELVSQLNDALQERIVGIETDLAYALIGKCAPRARTPDHAGERCDSILAEAHGLADLAHGRARAIADDRGSEAG